MMNNADLPAMPLHLTDLLEGGALEGCGGLTKREHFAGLALQGLLSSQLQLPARASNVYAYFTQAALMYADTLLEELEK